MAHRFRVSSGLFGLPPNAKSVDWMVVNDSATKQDFRVTVFHCSIGSAKTPLPPGPSEFSLAPNVTTHNANAVGPGESFQVGMLYEVVIDSNNRHLLPAVNVWSDQAGTIIAGTEISAGGFVRLK
jgi:hypothetical protein